MKMEERDRLLREDGEAIGYQKGLSQGLNQGLSQGLSQGRTDTMLSFINSNRQDGIPDAEILIMLQKFFQSTPEEAAKLLNE